MTGKKFSGFTTSSLHGRGFTLVEVLVVIAVLAIAGTLVLTIFTRSLRGNNKTQILSAIKQNGQAVLEILDKTLRDADNVVCIHDDGNTIVVVKDGKYTRFKYLAETVNDNGQIWQDFPEQPPIPTPPSTPPPKADIKVFLDPANVCTDPKGTDPPSDPQLTPRVLTDTNLQTGVSLRPVSPTKIFSQKPQSGFKNVVTVKFQVDKGVNAHPSLAGQIDPVTFETTIQLR